MFQNFETGSLEGCPKFGEDGDSDLNIPPPPAKPVLNVNNKLRYVLHNTPQPPNRFSMLTTS